MKEETLNLNEAATFFKMSPEALRKKIHTDKIPAFKSGKGWIFLPDDLIKYIRSKYKGENNFYLDTENTDTKETNNLTNKEDKKLSINNYSSQIKTEKEYKEALCSTNKRGV